MNPRDTFRPARSRADAIARLFMLTGAPDRGTRGEKRALLALAKSLDVSSEVAETVAAVAARIAARLDMVWDPDSFTERTKLSLSGLNVILEGAERAATRGLLVEPRDSRPNLLEGPEWKEFSVAQSKAEAVTRIAALTDAPRETLGPGSKERRSVLDNLADRLTPDIHHDRTSKTRLARSLARELDVPWDDRCESTGQTISLRGLNVLLAGAERRRQKLGSRLADLQLDAASEAEMLVAALIAGMPKNWDGRESIEWMARNDIRGAHDNEWQGFFGEARARLVLDSSFPQPPDQCRVRYGNTVFDYALRHVWDLKVHTASQDGAPGAHDELLLNDATATRACAEEQGVGFLIISGDATMDHEGEFVAWHRAFKARRTGRTPAPSNSGRSRMRKAAFQATQVEAFFVQDAPALDAAISKGALRVRPIGRQAPRAAGGSGAPRQDKFSMHLPTARESIRVALQTWS